MTKETILTMSSASIKYGIGATREVGFDMTELGARRVMVVADPRVAALDVAGIVLDSLKSEGIYIVQFSCAWETLEPHEEEGWMIERDGIRVKTIWDVEKEDSQEKLSYQVCKMGIDDHGKHIVLEDHHTLRLWLFEDTKSLIRESGRFKLEAIYNGKHERIPLDAHISGELGNLYYVLKVL